MITKFCRNFKKSNFDNIFSPDWYFLILIFIAFTSQLYREADRASLKITSQDYGHFLCWIMTAAEEDRSSGTDWQTCCTLHCARPPTSPHNFFPTPSPHRAYHPPLTARWHVVSSSSPMTSTHRCSLHSLSTWHCVFPMRLLHWKLLNPSSTPLWQTHGVRGQPPTSWCGWICRKIMLLAGDLTQEIVVSLRRKSRKRGDRKKELGDQIGLGFCLFF